VAAASRDKSKAEIAADLQLPILFINARNLATHETLPTLADLRLWVNNALEWLWMQFWSTSVVQDEHGRLIYVQHDEDQHLRTSKLSTESSVREAILQHLQLLVKDLLALGKEWKSNQKGRRKESTAQKAAMQRWKQVEVAAGGDLGFVAKVMLDITPLDGLEEA
jgi:hypothetical protein